MNKWNWDWFETIETLNWVEWKYLKKVVLEWAIHTNTLSHPQTEQEVRNFYRKIVIP